MVSFAGFVSFIGLLGLLHSAYSAAQHKSYLRLIQKDAQYLPNDILLQSLLSLVLAVIGLLQSYGDLKEIRSTAEYSRKTWEVVGNRPSFYTFKDGLTSSVAKSKNAKAALESST